MKIKEKNKTIAKWLGYEILTIRDALYIRKDNVTAPCDFFRDRNHQKLIENKLVEMGYFIQYTYDNFRKEWEVFLDNNDEYYIEIQNKSKDLAFIDIIITLIQNENSKRNL